MHMGPLSKIILSYAFDFILEFKKFLIIDPGNFPSVNRGNVYLDLIEFLSIPLFSIFITIFCYLHIHF